MTLREKSPAIDPNFATLERLQPTMVWKSGSTNSSDTKQPFPENSSHGWLGLMGFVL
jgi:hypothetical protein